MSQAADLVFGLDSGSFFRLDGRGNRQRAHFDGLPVDFIAEAIATLGARAVEGFETYHVMNPHDDGIGLDEVWSMTAVLNTPSQAVMRRAGLTLHGHFEHPRIQPGSPLRPHVVFRRERPS